ncbi:putative mucin TcSMUGL [Trypanosoma cruzi]|uniref:Putative mucin TcSMUGL n=1 Tax=Trypanosoma cruzi TaxID=5693 RepID=A0A2V2UUF9_TRYCR|nr:putative mucin TcSMUGL [Trypanosoma cruzi]
MISGSGQQPRRIYFFSSGWVCFLWALTVCVRVCWCPCGVAWLLRRVSVPLPRCLCSFVCMSCTCPCLFLPCCVLSLCPPGAGPTGEFTPRATSEVHKGPSDNDAAPRPLRAFSLPSAVRARAPRLRRRGSTMLLCLRLLGATRRRIRLPLQLRLTTTSKAPKNTTTTTSKAPKNTTTTTSKAPTPEDARSPGGLVWVQVPLLLLVSAAVATAGAAC